MKQLTLTEAGKRLGHSHTWVKGKIAEGKISASTDRLTGKLVVSEAEIARLQADRFVPYIPSQKTQESQPLQPLKPGAD